MNQGHPRDAAATPEERWRRTVDRRDRAKLKVGRLLRDFGFEELTADAVDQIEGRLASVGVGVQPRLLNADAKDVVTLEITGPAPAEPSSAPASDFATEAPPEADGQPPEIDGQPDPRRREDEASIEASAFPDPGSATDPLSRARAESARLLEERSQVERRLEAGSRQLKAAEQEIATLKDTLTATRREVQRAAAELQLALTGENEPSASAEQPKRD
jgi:hypothetical protein